MSDLGTLFAWLVVGLEFPKWVYVYRVRELERGWEIQI